MELFRDAIPPQFLDDLQTARCNAVDTPYLTVWPLVDQRLFGNATLHAAVAECLEVALTIKNRIAAQASLQTHFRFNSYAAAQVPLRT